MPPHTEFVDVMHTLARTINDDLNTFKNDHDDDEIQKMAQRAARIVRGRMECNLVSKSPNFMDPKHHQEWVRHVEAASAWFAVLIALLRACQTSEAPIAKKRFMTIVRQADAP